MVCYSEITIMQANNPFRPASDQSYVPSAFAGRAVAYGQMNQNFTDPTHPQAAVFIGRKGIGKSAMLWHFHEFFSEQHIDVYLPLRQLGPNLEDEASFLEMCASNIRQTLVDRDITLDRMPEVKPDRYTRTWFRDTFLPDVFREIRGRRRLVLLLDDAEVFLDGLVDPEIKPDLFTYLSRLLTQYDRLGMVITIDEAFEDALPNFSPLVETSSVHRLGPLTPDEVTLLMGIPTEYEMAPSAVDAVVRATGGDPSLLQHVGYHLYEGAIARNHPNGLAFVYPKEVREAVAKVVGPAHPLLQERWQSLTDNQRDVLHALGALSYDDPLNKVSPADLSRWLVESEHPLDEVDIRAALRGLEYAHFVELHDSHPQIASGIIQTWLLQRASSIPAIVSEPISRKRQIWTVIGVGLAIAILIMAIVWLTTQDQTRQPSGATHIPPPTVTLESSSD
jgi:hypothetical protein